MRSITSSEKDRAITGAPSAAGDWHASESTPPRARRRWYRRPVVIALLVVVVLVLGLWAASDTLARVYTKRTFARMEGFDGLLSEVHVSLPQLSYSIRDLKIVEKIPHENDEALFYGAQVTSRLRWRDLLRGRLVATADIRRAKSVWLTTPGKEPKEQKAEEAGRVVSSEVKKNRGLDQLLESVFPFRIDRLEVRDSEFLLIDGTVASHPELWFQHLEGTVENFATRRELSQDRPLTLAFRARVQRTGRLALFVNAQPLANPLWFAGEARLEGLDTRDLYEFLDARAGVQMPRGVFECYVSFECKENHIVGAVKPLIENADIEAPSGDIGSKLRAALMDAGLKLFSDRVPDRNAAATVIPIDGRLDDPQSQLAPTIMTLLRNAFVEGLAAGISNLPPKGKSDR